jgi:hypothetical protein
MIFFSLEEINKSKQKNSIACSIFLIIFSKNILFFPLISEAKYFHSTGKKITNIIEDKIKEKIKILHFIGNNQNLFLSIPRPSHSNSASFLILWFSLSLFQPTRPFMNLWNPLLNRRFTKILDLLQTLQSFLNMRFDQCISFDIFIFSKVCSDIMPKFLFQLGVLTGSGGFE